MQRVSDDVPESGLSQAPIAIALAVVLLGGSPIWLQSAEVQTYDDHRMAMSLALVGLRAPGVVVLDPECTAKTYPDYFQDLQSVLQTN